LVVEVAQLHCAEFVSVDLIGHAVLEPRRSPVYLKKARDVATGPKTGMSDLSVGDPPDSITDRCDLRSEG